MKLYPKILTLLVGLSMMAGCTSTTVEESPSAYSQETINRATIAMLEQGAQHNDSDALYNLALLYMDGKIVSTDLSLAHSYLQRAASKLHTAALNKLATLSLQEQNYKEALSYYRQAAQLNDLKALRSLTDLYYIGHYIPRNYARSFKYALQGARLNDSYLMLIVGRSYLRGDGIKSNRSKARYWLRRSCYLNNHEACFDLDGLLKYDQQIRSAKP